MNNIRSTRHVTSLRLPLLLAGPDSRAPRSETSDQIGLKSGSLGFGTAAATMHGRSTACLFACLEIKSDQGNRLTSRI